ncbi:MAG: ribose-5-phosphate isomerase RpiA [Spirochaetes bacterium]|nr:ribose-5-phosphate isomerase RpiA [Spirochaetota bacterium]
MKPEELKKLIGYKAVDDLVVSGMKIGLGTGSTAIESVRRVGEKSQRGELKNLAIVATSFETKQECQNYGLNVYTLGDPVINGNLDLTIDGADEVDPEWNLIKGGGGALLIEKIVSYASKRFCIIVDESKIVAELGEKRPVPIEVIPEAFVTVKGTLHALGGRAEIRMAKMKAGPVNTERGNIIVDLYIRGFRPEELEKTLNQIPGVVENGIFAGRTTDLYVAYGNGRIESKSR